MHNLIITAPGVKNTKLAKSTNFLTAQELSNYKERIFNELKVFLFKELEKRDYKVKPNDFSFDKVVSENDNYPDNVYAGDILIFNQDSVFSKLFKKPIPFELIKKLVNKFNSVLNLEKRMGLVLFEQGSDGYEFYLNAQKDDNPNKVRDYLKDQRELTRSLLH